jgi:hypothetical protein
MRRSGAAIDNQPEITIGIGIGIGFWDFGAIKKPIPIPIVSPAFIALPEIFS